MLTHPPGRAGHGTVLASELQLGVRRLRSGEDFFLHIKNTFATVDRYSRSQNMSWIRFLLCLSSGCAPRLYHLPESHLPSSLCCRIPGPSGKWPGEQMPRGVFPNQFWKLSCFFFLTSKTEIKTTYLSGMWGLNGITSENLLIWYLAQNRSFSKKPSRVPGRREPGSFSPEAYTAPCLFLASYYFFL